MMGYQIDPECPEFDELNEDFELGRQTAEYDPAPYLGDIGDDDCTD